MVEFLDEFESTIPGKEHLPAYLLEDQRISLGEVNSLANQFAHWLLRKLRGDIDVVGICAETSLVTGALIFGILKAGKVFLGLDPGYPPDRLRFMVEQSGCTLVLTDGVASTELFDNTSIQTISDTLSLIRTEPRSNPPRTTRRNSPAYVTFTSGSTGRPKAVLAPIRQVDNRFSWMWDAYPFSSGEVCCHRMPLSFVDTIWEILGPVCKGIPVALISAKRFPGGASLVEKLAYHQISRIWMLPAAINALVEFLPTLGQSLPHLRFWVCTGDTLSPGLALKFYRAAPGARLFNLYGTSEVWDATWYEVPTTGINGLFVPIGKAIKNIEVSVVGENRRTVRMGTVGEIAITGTGLALGYMTGSSVDEKQFLIAVEGNVGKGFYFTGDLGRFAEQEELIFLGRRESIVKRANHLVNLIEIESALTLHPYVTEGAVAASKTVQEPVITAYYSIDQKRQVHENNLLSFLRNYLPDETLPDRLVRLDRFPMTPSGKINRRVLAEWERKSVSVRE